MGPEVETKIDSLIADLWNPVQGHRVGSISDLA